MDLVGISDFDENEVLLMIDDGVIARMRKKSKEVPKTQHLKRTFQIKREHKHPFDSSVCPLNCQT
jgi:hypothetical protein